jgi:hypothetical protein
MVVIVYDIIALLCIDYQIQFTRLELEFKPLGLPDALIASTTTPTATPTAKHATTLATSLLLRHVPC